ncbi:SLAP domain-containing protein [Lactobacillus sp. ESL0680]|uniref:SLAP domain-containing protein n=1 Tax=Lactobacillus sp. ESL0680 TaxID=2983210 RepID=UPI0023F7FFF1|nr:SLAP domain-containing protein [Lactobacillus sp. ESL0680]WEV39220.1 SLAP domain-containing protein [Lactobacillus sp. ESL0680]
MKTRKILFTGIAAVSLLSVAAPIAASEAATSVQAALYISVTKKAYIYNKHGKKTKNNALEKGAPIEVTSTKYIKGKEYYRIGKNKYIKTKCAAIPKSIDDDPNFIPWTSQHLVDDKGWSLTEQMYKAEEMTGDQRQEAENEIAAELNMSYVKQLRANNNSHNMQAMMNQFHNAIVAQIKERQQMQDNIEHGGAPIQFN